MTIAWAPSAGKHGIPQADALYAMLHPEAVVDLAVSGRNVTRLYIGHPHAQALENDWLEVIVSIRKPVVKVFHVMPLSSRYSHLIAQ